MRESSGGRCATATAEAANGPPETALLPPSVVARCRTVVAPVAVAAKAAASEFDAKATAGGSDTLVPISTARRRLPMTDKEAPTPLTVDVGARAPNVSGNVPTMVRRGRKGAAATCRLWLDSAKGCPATAGGVTDSAAAPLVSATELFALRMRTVASLPQRG